MKKILLMNGPNLNMLGVREPEVYGRETLASIEAEVVEYGAQKGVQVDCFQSNHEGALIDKLHEAHEAYDGVVYNLAPTRTIPMRCATRWVPSTRRWWRCTCRTSTRGRRSAR